MSQQPVAAAVQLEYSRENESPPRRKRWRVASLVAMLPGLVVPFVPFACDQSAAGVLTDLLKDFCDPNASNPFDTLKNGGLWLLFFLPFPIVAWMIFRLRGRHSTRAGRVVCFTLGAGAGLALVFLLVSAVPAIGNVMELAISAFTALTVGFTALVVTVVVARRRGLADECISVILVGPYAATLLVFLVAYSDDAQIGWYLSLTPTAAAFAELFVGGAYALRKGAGRYAPIPGAAFANTN